TARRFTRAFFLLGRRGPWSSALGCLFTCGRRMRYSKRRHCVVIYGPRSFEIVFFLEITQSFFRLCVHFSIDGTCIYPLVFKCLLRIPDIFLRSRVLLRRCLLLRRLILTWSS